MINDPWGEDATQWNASDFVYLKAFGSLEIQNFCHGLEDGGPAWHLKRRCIVVGLRGLGKSFLLAHRSYQHRLKAQHDTFFHPYGGNPERLVEVLTLVSGAMTEKHWLRNRDAADSWSAVWQISILGLLAWRLNAETSTLKGFSEVFSKIEQLDSTFTEDATGARLPIAPLQWFLGRVIESAPSEREECQGRLNRWLYMASVDWATAILRALSQSNRQQIVIYLDNPDELVPLAETDVWTNAQQGLVLAIWKLRKGGSLANILQIFASIRTEAVSRKVHADLQHALGLAIYLHYDRDMLGKMFSSLCDLTAKDYLVRPELHTSSPVQAFLGMTAITHQSRYTVSGRRLEEPALDALIRHTRGIPRELVAIGRQIRMLAPSERTEIRIRSATNIAAGQNVSYIKANCFPLWSSEVDSLLLSVKSPVLVRDELFHSDRSTESLSACQAAVRYLISLGLLGYADPVPDRHRHYFLQRFVVDDSVQRPASSALQREYFFVHPALKEWMRNNLDSNTPWQSMHVLMGNGLPYEPYSPLVRLGIYDGCPTIHFGKRSVLRSHSSTDQSTEFVRFLFAALCVWKLHGGAIWPTLADINDFGQRLMKADSNLKFPLLRGDQSDTNSVLRNWARRINMENSPALATSHACPCGKCRASAETRDGRSADERRSGFLTVSAPKGSGSGARMGFVQLDPANIDLDDSIRLLR